MTEEPRTGRRHNIHVIYALAFIFSFAVAIPTYINSTFIGEFVGEKWVGLMFTLAAVLAIVGLALTPRLLRALGNFKITLIGLVVGISSLLGLAYISPVFVIVPLFIIYGALTRQIGYNTDLFLENFSDDKSTGGTRGAFLSITNMAWVLAPIVAGFLLGEDNYWIIYSISAVLFALLIPILVKNFKNYQDPEYDHSPLWQTLKNVYKNRDTHKLFSAYLILRFFYAWMVIYMPIYLHQHIGLEWSVIGVIFTIMLMPFVIFEYPLGKIADSKLGEKEMMSAGFVILGLATACITFVSTSEAWVWAALLFMTRVGASTVQVMSETYFFKKINSGDSEMLSLFRMTGPLSYVFAPLLASIILAFIDLRFLFLVLGVVVLFGLRYSLTIKDTL